MNDMRKHLRSVSVAYWDSKEKAQKQRIARLMFEAMVFSWQQRSSIENIPVFLPETEPSKPSVWRRLFG